MLLWWEAGEEEELEYKKNKSIYCNNLLEDFDFARWIINCGEADAPLHIVPSTEQCLLETRPKVVDSIRTTSTVLLNNRFSNGIDGAAGTMGQHRRSRCVCTTRQCIVRCVKEAHFPTDADQKGKTYINHPGAAVFMPKAHRGKQTSWPTSACFQPS